MDSTQESWMTHQSRRPEGSRGTMLKENNQVTFLMVQWLRLPVSNARGTGSIPGQGTKISRATQTK